MNAASDTRHGGPPSVLVIGEPDALREALLRRLVAGGVYETDSLLHLGEICDVHDVVASAIAGEILAAGAPHGSSSPRVEVGE